MVNRKHHKRSLADESPWSQGCLFHPPTSPSMPSGGEGQSLPIDPHSPMDVAKDRQSKEGKWDKRNPSVGDNLLSVRQTLCGGRERHSNVIVLSIPGVGSRGSGKFKGLKNVIN